MKIISAITPPLLLKVLAAVFLAAGLTSCSSMKVQNDWDKKISFSGYRTFAFLNAIPPENAKVRHWFEEATAVTLEGKGLRQTDEVPDLFVVVYGQKNMHVQLDVYTSTYEVGWGGVPLAVIARDVRSGAAFIDLIDSSSNKLVYRGNASKVLSNNPKKGPKNLMKAVEKMLVDFPPKGPQ